MSDEKERASVEKTSVGGSGVNPAWRVVAVAVLLAIAGAAVVALLPRDTSGLLDRAREAYESGDYEQADKLVREVLEVSPKDASALLLGAQNAYRRGRHEQALGYCEVIPADAGETFHESECLRGTILVEEMARCSEAEECFRALLSRAPASTCARTGLAQLLAREGRVRETIDYQLEKLQIEGASPAQLYALALTEQSFADEELMRRWLEVEPEAALAQIALARLAEHAQAYDDAKELLAQAVQTAPELLEGQAALGRLLLERGTPQEFREWYAGLERAGDDEEIEENGPIWLIKGDWAASTNETRVAARCYWEAALRMPNNRVANLKLGQSLSKLGRAEARDFLERARRLEEYRRTLDLMRTASHDRPKTRERFRAIVELAGELGFVWEQYGWTTIAKDFMPEQRWFQERQVELARQKATWPKRRETDEAHLAARIDLSDFPLPPATLAVGQSSPRAPANEVDVPQFAEQAASAGIEFRYFADLSAPMGIGRPFETTGGGVAVVDFDCDGWPDAYFAQGALLGGGETKDLRLDRLYRNLGDGRFAEVTGQCNVAEDRYSQGVTVGDFNADGFPDLYVANIGRNRLYENNGDGTFSESEALDDLDAGVWTTSCLLADLSGDGLPDVYNVSYLAGDDVLTRRCRDEAGQRLADCVPNAFDGAPDQLFVNDGEGGFVDVSRDAGIALPNGKGLGILAADFDGSGRLSLFVANDGVANFFLKHSSRDGVLAFDDAALLAGLAVNGGGDFEACMGVAADDFNGDGRLDLFVTNFFSETNTLYVRTEEGLFEDATQRFGLDEASRVMLAFGTQSLDADLDGWMDLFVTNGHIDDFTDRREPYRMPPQVFMNAGGTRFVEVGRRVADPYFDGVYLGRGAARLDWNRDGADDVIVSHLKSPAAVLTNVSEKRGRFLAVRLTGTVSNRDAVGTTVTVTLAGGRRQVRQLVAGDGYLSSNERKLVFGLGEAARVETLEVGWPSGERQTFSNVPADREITIVEGAAGPSVVP